ncbi:hypothetical protein Pla175_24910 [Pirellulimonas nuda]|uniref:Uncharacterized protein n=1 Tax=Pirellulimonas nuda TaxID=2528009 RepID=A0A518DCA8_9BACT|nr:hypothetical protein [Pirellulimonas nuda]QDU89105.1 hypothetical protein Pla175_24910 [Pirellulimonas nuda]
MKRLRVGPLLARAAESRCESDSESWMFTDSGGEDGDPASYSSTGGNPGGPIQEVSVSSGWG